MGVLTTRHWLNQPEKTVCSDWVAAMKTTKKSWLNILSCLDATNESRTTNWRTESSNLNLSRSPMFKFAVTPPSPTLSPEPSHQLALLAPLTWLLTCHMNCKLSSTTTDNWLMKTCLCRTFSPAPMLESTLTMFVCILKLPPDTTLRTATIKTIAPSGKSLISLTKSELRNIIRNTMVFLWNCKVWLMICFKSFISTAWTHQHEI